MLVVTGMGTGRPWEDRIIDLRVEDAPEPLPELRRLLRIKRAYMAVGEADDLEKSGDVAGAAEKMGQALAIAPEMTEIRFMVGINKVAAGDVDGGSALIAEVMKKDVRWLETVRRLAAADLVPKAVASAIETRLASRAK